MIINRQNILDLIGKDRRRYNQCIITTYSFDFFFFEERLLPVLRAANIRNVNVFVDGKFLDASLENTTGHEFGITKSYSLIPVYETGVFHPKIMLLTGHKNGLLIIGSGNLTGSGMNTNDEIWGAFHLDNVNSTNAPIFAQAWQYLNKYASNVKGFTTQKIKWLTHYSPWLIDILTDSSNELIRINQDFHLKLLSNRSDKSIYTQLIESLPEIPPQKINIISPYFDEKGQIITQLNSDLNPVEINCIIDQKFGILPTKLASEIKRKVNFYNWENCRNDFNGNHNRLHAKLFHFQYEGGLEYLMLGSANASIQALGDQTKQGVNGEFVIFLQRKSLTNWLDEVGVDWENATPVQIGADNKALLPPTQTDVYRKIITIEYAEIDGSQLTLFINRKYENNGSIQIYNQDSELIEQHIFKTSENEISIQLGKNNNVFKICIVDSNNNKISNFALVHNSLVLSKSNPDPQFERLETLFHSEFEDDEGISELLKYVDYDWADESDEEIRQTSNFNAGHEVHINIESINRTYETLTEQEFNSIDQDVISKQLGILSNNTVRIAEFLSTRQKDKHQQNQKFQTTQEQALLDDFNQQGEGDDLEHYYILRAKGKIEQKAIKNFQGRLDKFYSQKLAHLYIAKSLAVIPNQIVLIKELSNMLIAVQMNLIHYEKLFHIEKMQISIRRTWQSIDDMRKLERKYKLIRLDKYDQNNIKKTFYSIDNELLDPFIKEISNNNDIQTHEQDFSVIHEEHKYLLEGDFTSNNTTIKGFLLRVVGKFLLSAYAGFKKYEYRSVNDRMIHLQKEFYTNTILLILLLNWRRNENFLMELLLLDLLFLFNQEKFDIENIDDLIITLEEKHYNLSIKSKYYQFNLEVFKNQISTNFQNWISQYNNKFENNQLFENISELNPGIVIFNSKLGFTKVLKVNIGELTLEKPGFDWDTEYNTYAMKSIKFPSKVIFYNSSSSSYAK